MTVYVRYMRVVNVVDELRGECRRICGLEKGEWEDIQICVLWLGSPTSAEK